jgi:hypothetical protein
MEIHNVEELLKYIYEINPISGDFCFRGQTDYSYEIIPTVHRVKPIKLKRYQTIIFETILVYLKNYHKIEKPHLYTDHTVEFLAMCQHYGIPTRLLDWSNDVLISLYFACKSNFEKNGRIIICDKTQFKKFDFKDFEEKTNAPQIINTHIINPRIRSQSGCFMLWGKLPLNKDTSESYNLEDYCLLKYEKSPLNIITIPNRNKEDILAELFLKYGIDEKSVLLNNKYSLYVEKKYEKLKKIAKIITDDLTVSGNSSKLTPFFGNFEGCENLEGFPNEPMIEFYEIIDNIIEKF